MKKTTRFRQTLWHVPCQTSGCRGWDPIARESGYAGPSLCDPCLRLEWVRFCEVIAACVIAACVEDYAEARALDESTGVPFGDGDANVRAARDALCGRERA